LSQTRIVCIPGLSDIQHLPVENRPMAPRQIAPEKEE
jgi:hypothetical protein